jgi:hypothetical protein
MSTSVRRIVAVISDWSRSWGAATSAAFRQDASSAERAPVQLPAFQRAVFLSHVNDPATTPLFPGDRVLDRTVFTVPTTVLPSSRARRHRILARRVTSTTARLHGRPLAVRPRAACRRGGRARRSPPTGPPRPRGRPAGGGREFGQMPAGAAVLLLTGCSDFWARGDRDGEPTSTADRDVGRPPAGFRATPSVG